MSKVLLEACQESEDERCGFLPAESARCLQRRPCIRECTKGPKRIAVVEPDQPVLRITLEVDLGHGAGEDRVVLPGTADAVAEGLLFLLHSHSVASPTAISPSSSTSAKTP